MVARIFTCFPVPRGSENSRQFALIERNHGADQHRLHLIKLSVVISDHSDNKIFQLKAGTDTTKIETGTQFAVRLINGILCFVLITSDTTSKDGILSLL